ncbi:DUF4365 domain-containing protein [Streptomyces sp. CA-106110]|uniref:DUF4365 domain-containing protein n=1 Tax=Streptomyces sp. CA-106110 TaxID=3240044 RepID=UPI003D8D8E56
MTDPIGPKIKSQRLTGNAGESLVRLTFLEAHVPVISVDQGDDYGTDLILQVPYKGTDCVSGAMARIQVKCGKSKYHRSDGTGRCQIDAEHRAYYADGPIPSILITVDPGSKKMHWGNITEQLRRNPNLTVVSAPHAFSKQAVPQILRVARQASPGDWVLALSNSDPVARRIAIEGCLLTADQDNRALELLRAYTTRMNIADISFLALRITEEERKHFGQQTLMDFEYHFGQQTFMDFEYHFGQQTLVDFGRLWKDGLEERLPAQRSHWERPPYSRDLMTQLVSLFEFSKGDLLEIIERNQDEFSRNLLENGQVAAAASILDLHPAQHAERLTEIVIDGNGDPMLFMKALELNTFSVEQTCKERGIRVMDIIYATYREEPELAAAMWALWSC